MSLAVRLGRRSIIDGYSCRGRGTHSSIQALQNAFRDPKSPFHIPAGHQGPASPDELVAESRTESPSDVGEGIDGATRAREYFLRRKYDPTSFWEQAVCWGDQDSFQHVNNVRYLRFFESGRIRWMQSLGRELGELPGGIGGLAKAEAMLKGQGVSMILKSIEIKYKRPVTFPDTLLIAHVPLLLPETASQSSKSNTEFTLRATAYSYAQKAVVTESTAQITWYDYSSLRKCDPGMDARKAVWRRAVTAV